MIFFDKLLLLVLGVGAVLGFLHGFLKEIIGVFGLIVAAVLANLLTLRVSAFVVGILHSERVAAIVSWFAIFMFCLVQLIIIARLLSDALKAVDLSLVNRVAGAAFGVAKFALLLSFCLMGMQLVSSIVPALSIKPYVDQSRIAPMLDQIGSAIMPLIKNHVVLPAVELLKK